MISTPTRTLRIRPLRFAQLPTAAPEDRHRLVAEAAYFRAARRNFQPGHELDDWIAAEAEVEARLLQELAPLE